MRVREVDIENNSVVVELSRGELGDLYKAFWRVNIDVPWSLPPDLECAGEGFAIRTVLDNGEVEGTVYFVCLEGDEEYD